MTYKIIVNIALTLLIAVACMIFLEKIFKKTSAKNKRIHQQYLARLCQFIIVILAVANIVQAFNPDLKLNSFFLKGSALIVAIMGFAGQTAIADIISGFLISVNHPFEIGDRIIAEGLEPGIVEDITLRHTVIKIYDDFRIIVPNSQLNSKTLINTSYKNEERRGIHMQFSVSYDTDVQKAMDVIRDCVAESPYTLSVVTNGIAEDSGPVYFLKFADSALILETTIWINRNTSSYVAITDVNLRVNKAFREFGIEIPYNYLNVVEFEGVKPVPAEVVEKKKKTAPSKRHYRTNTLKIFDGGKTVEDAINTVQAYAKKQRLDDHAKMQLELLAEESIGVIKNMFSNTVTNFWIEGSGITYRIHLSFAEQMGNEEYQKLLNLSSSGKNEAIKGFAAHIWEAVLKGLDVTMGDSTAKKDYEWSIKDDKLNEDELSESILAAMASDIKVSATRQKVELVVIKSSQ